MSRAHEKMGLGLWVGPGMNGAARGPPTPPELLLARELARGWVHLYTMLLHPTVRDRRRAELESDFWEHQRHAARSSGSAIATAVELIARLLLGIPDDVLWRFGAAISESRAARTGDRAERSTGMNVAMRSRIAPSAYWSGGLWLLLVAVGVAFVLLDVDPSVDTWGVVFWGLAIVTVGVFIHTVMRLLALDHGRVGSVALILFVAGAALTAMVPVLAVLEVWVDALLPVGFGMVLVGWWVFAVANLRSRALPRWNSLPILIGLIPVLGGALLQVSDWALALGGVAFGIAWLLLGHAVATERDDHPRSVTPG